MAEVDYDWLISLGDEELLGILAFHETDYTDTAWRSLLAEAQARGFKEETIARFREDHLRVDSHSTTCGECDAVIVLDKKDLLAGKFVCPECKTEQLFEYPERIYRLSSSPDNESVVDIPNPPITNLILTQTPEIPTSKEEESGAPDEEISPDAPSGVSCAYCEKELRSDEVYEDGGQFYCTECFNDPRKRTVEMEEEEPDEPFTDNSSDPVGWRMAPILFVLVALVFIVMQVFECATKSH